MAKRTKRRPHWLDILVIAVIVVLIAGAVYKFKQPATSSVSGTLEPITYTVEIQQVRRFAETNIQEGDQLFDKTSGNGIGTIVGVELSQSYEPMVGADGAGILAEVENRYDVLLTVEAEALESDGVFYVNRTYELVSNSMKNFATKYFEGEGRVQDIWKS